MPASSSPASVPVLHTSVSPLFVLASPTDTMTAPVTSGAIRDAVTDVESTAWRAVAGRPDAALVGALPFDRHAPAHLFAVDDVHREPTSRVAPGSRQSVTPHQWRIVEQPSRGAYERAVREALDAMAAAGVDKVVLGRLLALHGPAPIDVARVFTSLRSDAAAHAFCVPLADVAPGTARTLVGASPELLSERRGRDVTSLPMAGSTPRRGTVEADQRAARALAESAKDLYEHRFVVEFVLDTLAPYCETLTAPPVPELAATPTLWHLATPVSGTLKCDVSSLELAAALHPTPAVCGSPRQEAQSLIARLEPFDREFFGGSVGWCTGDGDGRWVVAIRCAEIAGADARLFAGAGIVPGSVPSLEADETGAKFRTLLRALGAE